jgi:hypothetical protein
LVKKAPNISVAAAAATTTTAIAFISSSSSSSNEKLNKYKDLEIEVRMMWKLMAKIVPVITEALVTIKKGLDQSLQLLPDHPLAIELQKITQMSTAHIICEMLG